MMSAAAATPPAAAFNLVDVDPGAIRPVEKVQADESHGRVLDACLAPRQHVVTRRELKAPLDACILSDVVSPDESARLRQCAHDAEYSFWNAAATSTAFRNADTVEITSDAVANELWARVKTLVTPEVTVVPGDKFHEPGLDGRWTACGINPHLLFNHYKSGGHFSPHTDGATVVDMNHRSLYSVLIYLNKCEVGGGTALFAQPPDASLGKFLAETDTGGAATGAAGADDVKYRWPEEWCVDVAPVDPGTALVFSQDTAHEGVPVGEGHEKVVIRTDVMYRREPPVFADEVGRKAYQLHREAQTAEAAGDHMAAMRLYRHCRRLCPEYADFVGLG
jgi:leukotriene-A4 hydrolase